MDILQECVGGKPSFVSLENVDLKVLSSQFYGSNGPDNSKIGKVALSLPLKGVFRFKEDRKARYIDCRRLMAHDEASFKLRKEVKTTLESMDIDPKYFGSNDLSSLLSIPGMRGDDVLQIFPDGTMVRSTEKIDPVLNEVWARNICQAMDVSFQEPEFGSIPLKLPSNGGPLLNSRGIDKLRKIHSLAKQNVRHTRIVSSLVRRLQTSTTAKSQARDGVDFSGKACKVNTNVAYLAERHNFQFLMQYGVDISEYHGMRNRSAYGVCSADTMYRSFHIKPLIKAMYKKYPATFHHKGKEDVIRKLKTRKFWVKLDVKSYDTCFNRYIIETLINKLREFVPECHHWLLDAALEDIVLMWVGYDGKLNYKLTELDWNLSGWAYVSAFARLGMVAFIKAALEVAKLMQSVSDATMSEFLSGTHADIAVICEGDDVLIGSDDELFLKKSGDAICNLGSKIGVQVEVEDMLSFGGNSFERTEAGEWQGYPKSLSFYEKLLCPEYSVASKKDFLSIGYEARLAHYSANPTFLESWKKIRPLFDDVIGCNFDDMMKARSFFVPKHLTSLNAAGKAFLEDNDIIYKGKGISIEDIPKEILDRMFFNFDETFARDFFYEGDVRKIASYMERSPSHGSNFVESFVNYESSVLEAQVADDFYGY